MTPTSLLLLMLVIIGAFNWLMIVAKIYNEQVRKIVCENEPWSLYLWDAFIGAYAAVLLLLQ